MLCSQTIKGVVLDIVTREPIETASVYFDNTTIGTTTNEKGAFEITLKEGVKSPLIISFLGYTKVELPEYEAGKFYKILLEERTNILDEVYITNDDWSREAKLAQFKAQFLGMTKNGKSCRILNEDDIILRFDKKSKKLTASAYEPIIVENELLNYRIEYQLQKFEAIYAHDKEKRNRVNSAIYYGTSFYSDLEPVSTEKHIKNRKKAYEGSLLYFMRALVAQNLKDKELQLIFKNKNQTSPKLLIAKNHNTQLYDISLSVPVSILYKGSAKYQTDIVQKNSFGRTKKVDFSVDDYGNYTPVDAFYLTGYMANLRVGDTLPLDYALEVTDK